ncbi:acyltransferase family protein [Klebsiella aerogenes]|uniref:acyltransferase family protein n=1 Tax=Klebsiella aerogenes TaxID=548 RepID=UPI00385607B2
MFYGLLSALSLFVCLLISNIKPSAAFYLQPTRTWELFLGAFASAFIYKNPFSKVTQFLSLAVILFFSVIAKDNLPWPSLYTVIPTIATAMLLHTRLGNNETLLKHPVFQYLGCASYSIYLIHWPIVSLVYNVGYDLTLASNLLLSLSSIILGLLSYCLVEKRCKQVNFKVAMITLVLAGLCFF